jgi:very-short-patch-repair endonuclease
VDVVTVIERFGGLASRAELIRATSRADVDRALESGAVVRVGQGRYVLPGSDDAAALAFRLNGHLSLTNAALHHGWEVKSVPKVPHVVFPRKRNLSVVGRRQVVVHRADLGPDDVSGIATSRELTLMQCLRSLPDDEALAIADSALRHGEDATLRRVVASVRGAGSAKVRRIAAQADARAANPFESVTRAICLQVPGLRVTPQLVLSTDHYWACPDLVDRERRIVIECDSWEWHGDRKGFLKDVRRYTLLSADRWTVLRFTWDDVMLNPEWVHEVLCRVVGVDARTELPAAWCSAA